MSYKNLVISDQPVGYTGDLNDVYASNGLIQSASSGTRSSIKNNIIVDNSSSATPLFTKTNNFSYQLYGDPKCFYKGTENSNFTIEFWFSFNGTLNGTGYLENIDPSTRYYVNNELKIVDIKNGSTDVGAVLYDYKRNTFRFRIYGTGNTDAIYPVRNLDTNFYICAIYTKGSLTLSVNGHEGGSGAVVDNFAFQPLTGAVEKINFNVNSNSINDPNKSFIVSNLGLYNYILPKDRQRLRTVYAYNAEKPSHITAAYNTSFFELTEKDYNTIYQKFIIGDSFKSNYIYENNTNFSTELGIAYKRINSINLGSLSSGSISTSSAGLQVSASAYAQMIDFGLLFSGEQYKTITAQISNVTASMSTIFSMNDVIDTTKNLYATVNASGFYIQEYDPDSASSTSIISIPSTLNSASTYNVAFCMYGEDVHLYANNIAASATVPQLLIPQSLSLAIGNMPELPYANSLYIKNFGIDNDAFIASELGTSASTYDFSENRMYMARFTDDLSISQAATYISQIELSDHDTDIVGSKISWDGMDNCLVQYSLYSDAASGYLPWTTINNNEQLPIPYNTLTDDAMLRILVPYEYEIEQYNQSFNSIKVSLYKDLSILSNDGNYAIDSIVDTASSHSYVIGSFSHPIQQRQRKFGLSFDKTSGQVEGGIEINKRRPEINPIAIDFWFRPESYPSASNFIIDTRGVESGVSFYAYTNASGVLFYENAIVSASIDGGSASTTVFDSSIDGGEALSTYTRFIDGGPATGFSYSGSTTYVYGYVNGQYAPSGTVTLTTTDPHHLFFDFGGAYIGDSIYLNASKINKGWHSHGSYGFINIWNSNE